MKYLTDMKIIHKIKGIAVVLALLVFSCQEMDMETGTAVDDALLWSNPSYIDNYMVDLISMMPNGFWSSELGQGIFYANATDEAENANPDAYVQAFNTGNWNSVTPMDRIWNRFYKGIYKVNVFLEKSASVTFDTFTPSQQQLFLQRLEQYRAEARLLRALFYYELIRRYGGVVLVGDEAVLDIGDLSNPAFAADRSSFEECANYIIDECDYITDNHLLDLLDEGADQGRPNGTAAKALKCKTQVLLASPVYNKNISEGSTEQQNIWKEVAATAQDIAFDRIFSFGPYDVYDGTSPEVILGFRQRNINYLERTNFPVGCEGVNTAGSTNPTQNLVDAYRMLNGKKTDDPESGFDPENPYEGRDNRLLQTVIVNNASWKERNVEPRQVEIFRGGRDGMDRDYGTKTGYYLRKYIDPELDLRQNLASNREWPIFRFADIILIWAEAVNEVWGPANRGDSYLTATTILNQTIVRHGGLPELPLSGITKEELRERIREERFIELAFEDQRAWDLRRWGIAHEVLNEAVHKMEITRTGEDSYNYQKQKLEDRFFQDRMYLYPIPQRDVNNGLQQNSGW
jgi:hypothetical protein